MSKSASKSAVGSGRNRTYFVQRSYYYDTHDEQRNVIDTIDVMGWYNRIKNEWSAIAGVELCVVIMHDKDVKRDADGKVTGRVTEHIHAIVKYKNGKTQSAVMNELGLTSPDNCQVCKNTADSAFYMLHLTDSALRDGKHIYSVTDVDVWVGEPDAFDVMLRGKRSGSPASSGDDEDTSVVDELSERVRKGELSAAKAELMLAECGDNKLLRKYRKVFVDEQKLYMASVAELVKRKQFIRDLKTVYISGEGGSGKSLLADALGVMWCNDLGIHYTSTSGRSTTYDFVGNYCGEWVTISNELGSKELPVRQFLSLYDPHHVPTVSSRNYDKLWFSRYAVITNSEPVNEWIRNLMYYSGTQYRDGRFPNRLCDNADTFSVMCQVRRRIPYVLQFGTHKDDNGRVLKCIHVYKINDEYTAYIYIGNVPYNDIVTDVDNVAQCVHEMIHS